MCVVEKEEKEGEGGMEKEEEEEQEEEEEETLGTKPSPFINLILNSKLIILISLAEYVFWKF